MNHPDKPGGKGVNRIATCEGRATASGTARVVRRRADPTAGHPGARKDCAATPHGTTAPLVTFV